MNKIARLLMLCCMTLHADFSYQQSTGGNSGIKTIRVKTSIVTVFVKGHRRLTIEGNTGVVVDLDREVITDIDYRRHTYSLLSLAEGRRALEKMIADAGAPAMSFNVKLQDTGETRNINGVEAKRVIVTSSQVRSNLSIDAAPTADTRGDGVEELWFAEEVNGYDEVRAFSQLLDQKKIDLARREPVSGTRADNFGWSLEGSRAVHNHPGLVVLQSSRAMEIIHQFNAFSVEPIASSKFDVPSGFREIKMSIDRSLAIATKLWGPVQ